MRYILITLLAAICLSSCESPVEAYIKKHAPHLESLEILEESEKDSIYTPYTNLMFLDVEASSLGANLAELHAKAFKATSNKEAIQILDKAIDLYEKEYSKIDSLSSGYFKAVDFPMLSKEKNRTYIKAKYRLNGELKEQNFYFDKDGKEVGHTDEGLNENAKKLLSSLNYLNSEKRNIEKDKKDIKRGVYSF